MNVWQNQVLRKPLPLLALLLICLGIGLGVLPTQTDNHWLEALIALIFVATALLGMAHMARRSHQRAQEAEQSRHEALSLLEERNRAERQWRESAAKAEHSEQQLRRANEELTLTLAAAREATEMKSRFLAAVSHEIRTPLTGILGMNELLLCTRLNPDQRQFAEAVKDSTASLLEIVNDILDFSKIEAGKLEIERAPFDLLTTLRAVNTMLMPQVYYKGLRLECEVAPDVPKWVVGDALRLRQVLTNLVGNAVKFTEQGHITVSVEVSGGDDKQTPLHFSVEDTGIGIRPDQIERLFDEFAQADTSTARQYGGTGLGLSISKRLVEMMGGSISCQSQPGVGSTFSFVLPFAKTTAPPVKASDSRDGTTAGDDLRRKVLVVEDNSVNRMVAVRLLARNLCEVDAVESGQQAIDALAANEYDMVFMDVNMPGMDGFQTTAEIRKKESGSRRIPIVAMTARAMKDDRELCLASGMDDYLSKPIDSTGLRRVLETWAPTPEIEEKGSGGDEPSREPDTASIMDHHVTKE